MIFLFLFYLFIICLFFIILILFLYHGINAAYLQIHIWLSLRKKFPDYKENLGQGIFGYPIWPMTRKFKEWFNQKDPNEIKEIQLEMQEYHKSLKRGIILLILVVILGKLWIEKMNQ